MNLMNNIDSAPRITQNAVVASLVNNKNFDGAVGGFNRQAIRFVLLNSDLLNRVVLIDLVQNRHFADVIKDMDGRQMANFINNTGLIEQAEGATAIIANESGFLNALVLLSDLGLERVFNNRISNDRVKRIGASAVNRILRNPNFGGLFARLSTENQDWALEGMVDQVPFATFVSDNVRWITVPMLERIQTNHPNTFLRLDPASFTSEVMQNLLRNPAGRFLLNHVSIDVASKIGGADLFVFYDGLSRESFAQLVNGAAQFLNRISPAVIAKLLRVNTLQDLTTAGLIQILTTNDSPGAFINRLAEQYIQVAFDNIPPATLAGLNAGQANVLVNEFWYLASSQQLSAMMTSPTLGATYFDQPDTVGHIRVASLQLIEGSVLAATYQATPASVPIIRNAWASLTGAQKAALTALPDFDPPNGDLLVLADNPMLPNKQNALVESVINTPVHNPSDVQLDLLMQEMAVFNVSSSSTGGVRIAAQAGLELMNPPLRFASSAVQ